MTKIKHLNNFLVKFILKIMKVRALIVIFLLCLHVSADTCELSDFHLIIILPDTLSFLTCELSIFAKDKCSFLSVSALSLLSSLLEVKGLPSTKTCGLNFFGVKRVW